MFRKNFKDRYNSVFQWLTAFVVSLILINVVCFFYFRDPGGIHRDTGGVSYIVELGKYWINMEEGYGINKADDFGYINDSCNLDDNCIMIMGNSQTQGVNVMSSKRYVKLLNDKIQEDRSTDKMVVYSVTQGGADFCQLAQGVEALKEEFPQTEMIIIQISDGRISADALDNIYWQRTFGDEQKAKYMFGSEAFLSRTKNFVKDYVPILGFTLGVRLKHLLSSSDNSKKVSTTIDDKTDEKRDGVCEENNLIIEKLTKALIYIKQSAKVPVVILNLNTLSICNDATISINHSNEELWVEACDKADVKYVSMADEWNKLYEEENKLPYGFSNTRPGYGHLNPDGHRIISERLYDVLKQEGLIE